MKHQRLFTDNLELIRKLARISGRRHHFSQVELEDFEGYVNLELLKDDCATLRKFQNRSSWWKFLAAVIEKLALDFLIERWGRWRPSAMAEKLGPAAVLLDRLVNRDGHTLDEAMEIVRTSHAVGLGYADLRAMWEQLPTRQQRMREVGEEFAADLTASDSSEVHIEDQARQEDIKRLEETLHAALGALSAHERVILALRFDHDLSVADIAKATKGSVANTYRQLDRSLDQLRAALARGGFDPREISSLIGQSSVVISPLLRKEVEKFLRRVRLSKRDG